MIWQEGCQEIYTEYPLEIIHTCVIELNHEGNHKCHCDFEWENKK